MNSLSPEIQAYQEAKAIADNKARDLRERIQEVFPTYSCARHISGNIVIIGVWNRDIPIDYLPCIFENRNVWYKSVEDLIPIPDKQDWPKWARDYLLEKLPGRRAMKLRQQQEERQKEQRLIEKESVYWR